jgi:capsular polysaccharide biosynthesis protein/Mrp family chromosome partitioning ATPase
MDAPASGDGFTMSRFAAAAWRRAWVLVLVAGAAALAAYLVARDHPRVHEAKAVLLVGPLKAGINTLRASGPLAETYAELARSRPLLAETGRRMRQRGLREDIEVSANQTTRLVTVQARDPDPVRAARIANAHAASLVAFATRRAAAGIPSGRVQVVDPAVPGRQAVGLDATTLTILAGLLGLVVALGGVALRESSRSTIRDGGDLEAVAGVPCLASVGRAALLRRRRPVVERNPASRAADEYRLLAAKVDALGARSVAVVSVDGAPGGVVAANLVGALSASGRRVAAVDLDDVAGGERDAGDDPSAPSTGVAGDASGGRQSAGVALRRASPSTVEEAVRGGAEGARAFLRQLLAESDVVVLHPAGGADSSNGLVWARVAEATLLAVQRQRTPRREVASAVQSLRLVRARLAGAVLTAPSRRG